MLFGTIILLLATGQIFLVYKRDVISENLAAISENLAAISEKIQGSPLHLSLYFFSFYSFKRKGRGEKMLEKGKNSIKMVKMFYENSVNFYSGEIRSFLLLLQTELLQGPKAKEGKQADGL